MRVTTKIVFQMNRDGTFTELERDSYEYHGPVAQAFGGDSDTESTTTTTTDIDTTQVGIESVEGIGIAAAGDVAFNQDITLTDRGAIESSFEFAEEIGSGAFDFASDISRQAGETARAAVATSRQAIATVATGGADELAGINSRTIAFIVAGLAAVFIIPQVLRRA